MPTQPGRPAIVIPTWDGWDELNRCLGSMSPAERELAVVVDNGSTDGTAEKVAANFPEAAVVRLPSNVGFAAAVNAGIAAAPGRDVVLLNNDTVTTPGWLDALLGAAGRAGPTVGFVQGKMLRLADRLLDNVGDAQSWAGIPVQLGHGEPDRGQWDAPREVFSACGGASWYRRAMLDELGGFAERYFAYYEDVDLCSRAQLRGWTGLFAPESVVLHAVSASSGRVSGFKRYQSTRNSWWLVARTIPGPLLPRLLPRFAAWHALLLAQAVVRGELRAALRGHAAGLRGLPGVLAERRAIQAAATVEAARFSRGFVRRRAGRTFLRAFRRWVRRRLEPVPITGRRPNADAALRYRPVARLVAGSGRVLEVGSGSAGITAYASPPLVIGVDDDFAATAEWATGALRRVAGSGLALPFGDGTFDACLSVDALEHVPAADRGAFVAEMRRVTRPGGTLILACPVGRWAGRADRNVDRAFRRRHGRPHPWLAEHLAEGLPGDREIRRLLAGGTLRVHRNGWLPLWILLQRITFSHSIEPVERVVGSWAERLAWPPSYRRIYQLTVP